jgi:hypothetical protein
MAKAGAQDNAADSAEACDADFYTHVVSSIPADYAI